MQVGSLRLIRPAFTPFPATFFRPPRSAYTLQVPHLFSDTLRNNLLLELEKSDAALGEALRLSVFAQDVAAMPMGLATLVGTRGVPACRWATPASRCGSLELRQPELLIFDDFSSALDVKTEQRLWEGLFAADRSTEAGQPTCLITSNRPDVLRRADRIIVLNEGRVEAMGRFNELPSLS